MLPRKKTPCTSRVKSEKSVKSVNSEEMCWVKEQMVEVNTKCVSCNDFCLRQHLLCHISINLWIADYTLKPLSTVQVFCMQVIFVYARSTFFCFPPRDRWRLVVARYFQPDMVGFKFPCTPVMHCSIGDLLMFYCNRSQRTRGAKRSLLIDTQGKQKNLHRW